MRTQKLVSPHFILSHSLSLFFSISLYYTHTQTLFFPQPTVVNAILPSHAQTGAQGPRAAFDRHYR